MFENTVRELLNKGLADREDLFLIDFSITGDNAIKVIIDGDLGVKVEDCMHISRAIEHNLDRELVDFSLEVASAGAAAPLKLPRQYKKNIGRKLEIKTGNNSIEGNLVKVNEESIDVEWKTREPKPIGKGKVTVQKTASIAYKDIVEAKVMIKF